MTNRTRASSAVWMIAGALLTAAAATVWGLLRDDPADVVTRERDDLAARLRAEERESARLREAVRVAESKVAEPKVGAVVPAPELVPAPDLVPPPEHAPAPPAEPAREEGPIDEPADAVEQDMPLPVAFPEAQDAGPVSLAALLLRKEPARPIDLVSSRDRFAALFLRRSTGTRLASIPPATQIEEIGDGVTIDLPAGIHVLDLRPRRRFPRDLTIRGAGMDETLLVGHVFARDEIQNLAFEDLTVHTRGRPLIHSASEMLTTVLLDRCRVVGFDRVFYMWRGAVLANRSRFEAGYVVTSNPLYMLFMGKGGVIARFDQCTFLGPIELYGTTYGKIFVYANCAFEAADPGNRPIHESRDEALRRGLVFLDCTFGYAIPPVAPRRPWRSLRDVNPEWTDEAISR